MQQKTTPFPYQQEIINKSYSMEAAFMRLDPGLGKTLITIDSFCRLFSEGLVDNVIVVTKKSVAENWYIKELPEHMWDNLGYSSILWGYKQSAEAALLNFCRPSSALKILCINIEALRSDKVFAMVDRFCGSGRTFLVVDESTIIKTISAKQTRRVIRLAGKAKYRRCLSGEPAPNGPLDLYSQYKFLSEDIFQNYTKARFEQSFCNMELRQFGGRRILVPQGFSESGQRLFEQIAGPYTFALRKEDVDLPWPDVAQQKALVQLTESQKTVYQALHDDVVAELQESMDHAGRVRADVIIARLTKLHQITSGFVVTEEGETASFEENPKLEALKAVLPDKPAIIWCHYRFDVETVYKALEQWFPGQVGRVYGGVKDHDRIATLAAFNSGNIRYLVANPASIGWGLTLTLADTAIYYSNHYNYEYRVQSRDRIHRIGQRAKTVTYVDIVAEKTVDEAIQKALLSKEKFSDRLFLSEFVQHLTGSPTEVVGELEVTEDEEEQAA